MRLYSVPSYLHARDLEIEVEGLGPLRVDIAYGGNFYAVVEPQPNWPGLTTAAETVALSRRLLRAMTDIDPVHPEDLRLQRGRMLLAETNLSVTDVAMACGYASRSAFSKGFRAKFGTSPQAFNTFANRGGDDAPP